MKTKLVYLISLLPLLTACVMHPLDRLNPVSNAIYYYEIGNYDRARELYEELWSSGERSPWVCEHLGSIYENGLGSAPPNSSRAFELYSKGADQESQISMLGLYRLYNVDGNIQMADYWLDILARHNNREAIAILQREARPIPSPDLVR